jgi:hypothetical protein
MLISLVVGSFDGFWSGEVANKTGRLAAANGIVLLGTTFVLDHFRKWLPALLAKRVEPEFGRFWSMVGPREFSEIEDYKFTFGPSHSSEILGSNYLSFSNPDRTRERRFCFRATKSVLAGREPERKGRTAHGQHPYFSAPF